jgi:hypothetical protein
MKRNRPVPPLRGRSPKDDGVVDAEFSEVDDTKA